MDKTKEIGTSTRLRGETAMSRGESPGDRCKRCTSESTSKVTSQMDVGWIADNMNETHGAREPPKLSIRWDHGTGVTRGRKGALSNLDRFSDSQGNCRRMPALFDALKGSLAKGSRNHFAIAPELGTPPNGKGTAKRAMRQGRRVLILHGG